MKHISILATLLLLTSSPGCKQVPVEKPVTLAPSTTLAFITGLQGALDECLCDGDQPARLARLAARVEALRREGPLALFVVGDTFFPTRDAGAAMFEIEGQRAATIAAIIARLEPAAILLGPSDFGPHYEQVRRLAEEHRLPIFSSPRKDVPHRFKLDNTVRQVGGLAIGVLGAPGEAAAQSLGYGAGAIALRAHDVALVLALIGESNEETDKMLRLTKAINVAVASAGAGPKEPRMLGPILVVDAGSGGEHLGLLRLHPGSKVLPTPKDWIYDDLRRTYPSPADPNVALPRPSPTGATVTWETATIDVQQPPAPWAAQLVAECSRALRAARACPQPVDASTPEPTTPEPTP